MPLSEKDLRVLAAGVAPTIRALTERVAALEADLADAKRQLAELKEKS